MNEPEKKHPRHWHKVKEEDGSPPTHPHVPIENDGDEPGSDPTIPPPEVPPGG